MEKIPALARNILLAIQREFVDPGFDRTRYLLARYPELGVIDLPASLEELRSSWRAEAKHIPSSQYIAEGLLRRVAVAMESSTV